MTPKVMLCIACHRPREVATRKDSLTQYARCACGAIGIVSEADWKRDKELVLSAPRKRRKR